MLHYAVLFYRITNDLYVEMMWLLIWHFAVFYYRPSAVLVDLSYSGLLQPALAQQAADDYRVTRCLFRKSKQLPCKNG